MSVYECEDCGFLISSYVLCNVCNLLDLELEKVNKLRILNERRNLLIKRQDCVEAIDELEREIKQIKAKR